MNLKELFSSVLVLTTFTVSGSLLEDQSFVEPLNQTGRSLTRRETAVVVEDYPYQRSHKRIYQRLPSKVQYKKSKYTKQSRKKYKSVRGKLRIPKSRYPVSKPKKTYKASKPKTKSRYPVHSAHTIPSKNHGRPANFGEPPERGSKYRTIPESHRDYFHPHEVIPDYNTAPDYERERYPPIPSKEYYREPERVREYYTSPENPKDYYTRPQKDELYNSYGQVISNNDKLKHQYNQLDNYDYSDQNVLASYHTLKKLPKRPPTLPGGRLASFDDSEYDSYPKTFAYRSRNPNNFNSQRGKVLVGGQYAEPPGRFIPETPPNRNVYSENEFTSFGDDHEVSETGTVSSYINYKHSNMAFSPQNLNDAFSV